MHYSKVYTCKVHAEHKNLIGLRAIFGLLHWCKIYTIIFLVQVHVCVDAPLLVLKKKNSHID